MKIAAKPTKYGGVEFRSRLEARFAEMLDRNQIDWAYEPETYLFGNYQPDFYLQNVGRSGLFVEIKPRQFIDELSIFWAQIWRGDGAWICVDKSGIFREEWLLLQANEKFRGCLKLCPNPAPIQFSVASNGRQAAMVTLDHAYMAEDVEISNKLSRR